MIVGYARVSTEEQKLDLQIQALEKAGCEKIFSDHGQSGGDFTRCGLQAVLQQLKSGDTLVVWRLDRLGRSLSGLVTLMDDLGGREINFHSISENINTASSGGRLMFHMMAALAEFERSLISERTRAGMAAAKAHGKALGRPNSLTNDQIREAQRVLSRAGVRARDIADQLGVSTRTLRRHLRDLSMRDKVCEQPPPGPVAKFGT